MRSPQAFDAWAGSDDASAGHFWDPFFFQAVGRRSKAVAGGQHRVEDQDVGLVGAGGKAEVIADRLKGFLVAEHTNVADGG